jgi:hypothetical protein
MTGGIYDLGEFSHTFLGVHYQYRDFMPESYELSGCLGDERMDYFLQSYNMLDAKIEIMKGWLK